MYISVDVETDGPIPGRFSMLSLGMAVCGTLAGQNFVSVDPRESVFYRELAPISESFSTDALKVSGLDREQLLTSGTPPLTAMTEAVEWIMSVAGSATPVFVGYPAVFDWMFVHWYFVEFAGGSPFGYGHALDTKSLYFSLSILPAMELSKRFLPARLATTGSHNALEDAIAQAIIFQRVMRDLTES